MYFFVVPIFSFLSLDGLSCFKGIDGFIKVKPIEMFVPSFL